MAEKFTLDVTHTDKPFLSKPMSSHKEGTVMLENTIHPGAILKEELGKAGITLTEFARQIDVPPNRISMILSGKRSITGDTALRFGHWFQNNPQFWLDLQGQFDLAIAGAENGIAIRSLPTKDSLQPKPEQDRLF
jgi:addiction module HigA family antidote